MRRVFLAGTTTGTTWRKELIGRLIARGVRPEQIINPHLPPGVRYTPDLMEVERAHKRDPEMLVLVVLCLAVIDDTKLDSVAAKDKAEWLGPISMFEMAKFAYSQAHRTGVVLDTAGFTEGGRPLKVLRALRLELDEDFQGKQPYFPTLAAAEDWLVSQLASC